MNEKIVLLTNNEKNIYRKIIINAIIEIIKDGENFDAMDNRSILKLQRIKPIKLKRYDYRNR